MARVFNRKSWIIAALRRASYRYPPRNQAKIASRRARGEYECSQCHGLFGPKEIQLDHIVPVIPIEGFTGWDTYVERLFCELEGYQVLCKDCHSTKTIEENKKRKEIKDLTKPKKKSKLKE